MKGDFASVALDGQSRSVPIIYLKQPFYPPDSFVCSLRSKMITMK